ncbi:MAG: hypothetical protein AAB723_03575, partial [Patescibacteria group bacterium]
PMWQHQFNGKQMAELPAYLEKKSGVEAPAESTETTTETKPSPKAKPAPSVVLGKDQTTMPAPNQPMRRVGIGITPESAKTQTPPVVAAETKKPPTAITPEVVKAKTPPIAEAKPLTKPTVTTGSAKVEVKPSVAGQTVEAVAGLPQKLSNKQVVEIIDKINAFGGKTDAIEKLDIYKTDLIHPGDRITVSHTLAGNKVKTYEIIVKKDDSWSKIIKNNPKEFNPQTLDEVNFYEDSGQKSGDLQEIVKQPREKFYAGSEAEPQLAPAEKFYAAPEVEPQLSQPEIIPSAKEQIPVKSDVSAEAVLPLTPEKTKAPADVETWFDLKPSEKSFGPPAEIKSFLENNKEVNDFVRDTRSNWETFRTKKDYVFIKGPQDDELYYSVNKDNVFGKLEKNQSNVFEPKDGIFVCDWQNKNARDIEAPMDVVAAGAPGSKQDLLVNQDLGRIFDNQGKELPVAFAYEYGEKPIYTKGNSFFLYDQGRGKVVELPIAQVESKIFTQNPELKTIKDITDSFENDIFKNNQKIDISERLDKIVNLRAQGESPAIKVDIQKEEQGLINDLMRIKPKNKGLFPWINEEIKKTEILDQKQEYTANTQKMESLMGEANLSPWQKIELKIRVDQDGEKTRLLELVRIIVKEGEKRLPEGEPRSSKNLV